MEYLKESHLEEQHLTKWTDIKLSEVMFCLCLISIFLPIKIYPLVFLMGSFIFFRDADKLKFPKWSICLLIYSVYAVFSFLRVYQGESFLLTNLIKLVINFIFLFFAVNWLSQRDNTQLLKGVDLVLHVIFILVLVQLFVYHQALGFRLIYGSSSSGQASMLYNIEHFFWGLEDKNMFGARIAMLGFPYIMIPLIRFNKIALWRIFGIFLLAYLSLSRTPIVALLIGVFFLIWIASRTRWRIILLFFMGVTLPILSDKLIRIGDLTATNDGMGVRLVYWKAFFEHFTAISPLGNGFLSAPEFLAEYAQFYRGEPHLHNTFMSNYLEMGVVGFISYCLFLIYFYLDCQQELKNSKFWLVAFLPLLSIMMILYSGYDNDIVIYLTMIFMLGSIRMIDFKTTRIGI